MSYLADPPYADGPIKIEGAVFYNYIIVQQGATAMRVTADPDFVFHLFPDEPALLRLKYIGDPVSEPTVKTVQVFLDYPEGTALHSVDFMVLVPHPEIGQRVPNITNVKSIHVAPNDPIDFGILTDLARCSATLTEGCIRDYSAGPLPATLTINEVGRITGRAPPNPSWHIINLRATAWQGSRYIRFIVLIVGNGGAPLTENQFGGPPDIIPGTPIGDPIIPPPPDTDAIAFGLPAPPGPFYDGDYTIPQIAGMPVYEIPFISDPKPYTYIMTYWQFLSNYADIDLGTPGPAGYGGIYVGLVPGSFKQIGGGIVEFKREFAQNPPTRNEYETFVYEYRLVFYTFGFPNFCTQGTPLLVHSRVQYDYFATSDPSATIWLPRAPKLLNTCLGLVMLGEFPDVDTPTGEEVLAEDATYKIWKPGIYERRMRYVKWISSVDLIFNDA